MTTARVLLGVMASLGAATLVTGWQLTAVVGLAFSLGVCVAEAVRAVE